LPRGRESFPGKGKKIVEEKLRNDNDSRQDERALTTTAAG